MHIGLGLVRDYSANFEIQSLFFPLLTTSCSPRLVKILVFYRLILCSKDEYTNKQIKTKNTK